MIKKIIFCLLFAQLGNAQTIRYVKVGGSGTQDGLSWANASGDLQAMINASVINPSNPSLSDVVYVAKGTYVPTTKIASVDINNNSTTNRDKAFILPPRIKIYGGFDGTDNTQSLASRNFTTNQTILSGDIDNNDVLNPDGTITGNDNNAYHVLLIASALGIYNTTQVNGFTITSGNANGNSLVSYNGIFIHQGLGGGIYSSSEISSSSSPASSNSSPSFYNCIIRNNSATSGGGVYSSSTSSSTSSSSTTTSNPEFINCEITNNSATNGNGGGIYSRSNSYSTYSTSNLRLINCTISNNSAIGDGGGLYSSASTSFTNTSYSTPEVYNTIFWENKKGTDTNSSVAGADIYSYVNNNGTNGIIATNCMLQLAQASSYTAGSNNPLSTNFSNMFNVNPLFISALDYRLKTGSPAINVGNNSVVSASIAKDLAGNNRIISGTVDMGAYEFDPNALGVNEVGNLASINVYPNPVADILTIKMENLKQVSLYSIDGKLLLKSTKNEINLSSLHKGVYTAKIENTRGDVFTKKIMKK